MPAGALSRRPTAVIVVVCFATIAVAAYLIWDAIIFHQVLKTDFATHLRGVQRLLAGDYRLSGHFLFHTLTAATATLFKLSAEKAAVWVMTGSSVASAAVIFGLYLSPMAARRDLLLRLVLTISALVASAIFVPCFNRIYSGQSSPNVWHNPTNVLLKPFALISAFYLERICFTRAGLWPCVILIATIVAGALAKPAFALIVLPVLIFIIIATSLPPRWRFFSENYFNIDDRARKILLTFSLLGIVLVAIQGIYIFAVRRPEIHIVVAPFAVWSRRSPFIPLSILLAVAFPAAVTLIDWSRRIRLEGLALAWALLVVAFFIRSVFAETGDAMMHGNFGWPYQIALSVLFAFSVRSYYHQVVSANSGTGFWITSGLLIGHVASGFYYLYQLLILGSYA